MIVQAQAITQKLNKFANILDGKLSTKELREELINYLGSMEQDELDEFMHLYMCNRGVLMTPFHNMALMCPTTTQEQVDRHGQLFKEAIAELVKS